MIARSRIRAILRCASLATVLLVASASIGAQLHHIHTYTELDGLPSTDVRGVARDGGGLVWFATRNGVASYDGRSWQTFDEAHGLPIRAHELVAVGESTPVWVVSDGPNNFVSVFEAGKWKTVARLDLKGGRTFSLVPLPGRRAWLGTSDGLFLLENGVATAVGTADGTADGDSGAVYGLLSRRDRFFAATHGGLFEVEENGGSPKMTRIAAVPAIPIKGLASRGDGSRIWLVGEDWVGAFDGSASVERLCEFQDLGARGPYRVTASAGPAGDLFFGCAHVFHLSSRGVLLRLGTENGLVGESAYDLLADGSLVWIASSRGVSKIVSLRFANYTQRQGLLDDEVSAILERRDGTFVLGQRTGLTFFGDTPRTIPLGDRTQARVLDLCEDRDGSIWIAAFMAGIFRIDSAGVLHHHPTQPGWRGRVNATLCDREGRVWFATDGGAIRLDVDRFVRFPLPKKYPRCGLRRLFLDSEGRLVAASMRRGLFRLDEDGWRRWCHGTDADIDNVYAYLDRTDAGQWVGSTAGLFKTEGDRLVRIEEPRVDRPVYFIVEDAQRRVWLGTDNGVYLWNGQTLRHFTRTKGLAGREANRAAGLVDSKNRVWIGTEGGLSIYRPDYDNESSPKPELRLLSAEAGGERWSLQERLSLTYDQSTLSFRYRVTSFTDEREIRVRTRLEGLQDAWQPPVRPAYWNVNYNYLAPGTYRLHLQAVSAEGVWSDTVTSPEIVIHAPFWNRAWFHALVLIAMGALGYGAHLLFANRRNASRLEREIAAGISELRRTEGSHHATLRSIAECVVTTDTNGRIQLMNAAAERITGVGLDSARGQPLATVLPLTDGNVDVTAGILGRISQGDSWSSEEPLHYRARGGSRLALRLSAAPIRDGAEIHGAVLAFRDITDRLRLEREASNVQRIRSLGFLAGGIAHDFNNLLTVVLGNVSLLSEPGDEDRQKKLDTIEAAVIRARDLTQQLLTFSRGGAPIREAMHIGAVIRDSVSLTLSGANVNCVVDLEEDLWLVEVDEGQINQVLNNLLINAMHAMPDGGTIRIRARNLQPTGPTTANSRSVVIEIADEGCGIPKDQLPFVFDPYFSTKRDGHGLGLSTSYSIVQRHGGYMSVESEAGRGSVFRIQLPASARTGAKSEESGADADSGPCRVLVLDDDEVVRESVATLLESMGHEVECAADGGTAIDLYQDSLDQEKPYDVLLMDLTIRGGMGGREALGHLKEVDPGVRAIVVSGYSNDEVMSDFESYGFRASIQKPFRGHELESALRRALK